MNLPRTLFVGLAMVESTRLLIAVVSDGLIFRYPFWIYFKRTLTCLLTVYCWRPRFLIFYSFCSPAVAVLLRPNPHVIRKRRDRIMHRHEKQKEFPANGPGGKWRSSSASA